MIEVLKNAFKVPELRKKVLFTLAMLFVFRIGVHVPVPGIDRTVIENLVNSGQLLGFFDVISGGAFKKFSVFAMSITPYVNASIILQLLAVVIPSLEKLSKDPDGRKKIASYTRYFTVVLAFIQAIGISVGLQSALITPGWTSVLLISLSLTAGTAFLMWLGELINDKGIGNGISIIIFAGIVSRLPGGIYTIFASLKAGTTNILVVLLIAVAAILMVAAVVCLNEGQRRIPVQYAKRVVGRKVYGGQSTHIPLKVNQAGVIPIIFAMTLLMFPGTIASWFPNSPIASTVSAVFDFNKVWYQIIYALLIVFFTFFYSAITLNVIDIADNMKKYGGFIPGLRPGRPTSDYLAKISSRITLAGAIFLACIAVIPTLLMKMTSLSLYLGSTSLLIVVGVALDTMKQMESQLMMRNYQGFLKK
ncbi:MAG TPA: preprotein translocase subunit SecY [Peptococcaceae bacterium]|nr:preprotein translocase subunit SecY [Peptococcaceae bacterium]